MEDLRQLWQQYDDKLRQTQTVNEEALCRLRQRHATDRIERLRNMEYAGVGLLGVILFLVLARMNSVGSRWELQLSYWLVVGQAALWLAWGFYKIGVLRGLQPDRLPVTTMMVRLNRFRLLVMRERIWGGVAMCLFFLTPAVFIGDYWINDSTAYLDHAGRYVLTRLLPGAVVGMAVGLWTYRRFYLRPIDTLMEDVREAEAFRIAPAT